MSVTLKIATFSSNYEYEIEYEYDFPISKQWRSQSSRSSLLLTSRKGYYGNDIGGTDHNRSQIMLIVKVF